MFPTITLCKGAGDGQKTACLATAVAMIAGHGEQSDHPDCLCPIIAQFVRPTNDMMTDAERDEFYSDLPWQIIGTVSTDPAVYVERAKLVARAAQEFATLATTDPATRRRNVLKVCRETILAMAQVGNRIPIEPTYSPEQLAALLKR